MPLVTVIVPVFNGARTVTDTLESVLAQTHSELEVIVVDDGSTDATLREVTALADRDPRVRVLRQRNSGVARARNHGLSEANGSLVAFVDADDLWRPDKLAKQVRCLREGAPDVAVVYSWYAEIDEEGMVLPPLRPKPPFRGDVSFPLLVQNFLGNASTPLMRTSAVKRVGGYDETLRDRSGGQGFEDWHLYLKLAEASDFDVVEEFLTGYRQADSSMSHDLRAFLANFREAQSDIWSRHDDLPGTIRLWSELYLLAWMIRRANDEGRKWTALRLAGRALVLGFSRDPLLPFRRATRTFIQYVLELRRHETGHSPGPFLKAELVVDMDSWARAHALREAFLTTLLP